MPLPSEISWKVSYSFGVAIWKVKQLDIIPLKYHSIRSSVIHTTETVLPILKELLVHFIKGTIMETSIHSSPQTSPFDAAVTLTLAFFIFSRKKPAALAHAH